MPHASRREFLVASFAGGALLSRRGAFSGARAAERARDKLPVAAIVTHYTRNSHADVIVGKILAGWAQDGGPGPDLRLATLYCDQFPEGDLARDLARKHGFRIVDNIADALLVDGALAVNGVLCIGEHGNYPATPDTGQVMYPRRRFFDATADAFDKCRRVAPVFNDKHLAYAWNDAKHIVDRARKLNIPFLAGSSVPVAWRRPALELPRNCELENALAIGYGGLEAYGFHALEALQCMVERRRGGETGVRRVQAVRGEAIWQAERAGRWSRKLFDAAAATAPPYSSQPLEKALTKDAAFYLIEYADGLKATVAMANGFAAQFAFAAQVKGQRVPVATWLQLQEEAPFGHFAYLLEAIEHTVHSGRPAYPVERTLLTSGVLDELMHSLAEGGRSRETPHLNVAYTPADWQYAPGQPPSQPRAG